MNNIKKDFYFFENNPTITYLDTTTTSLKPKLVINNVIHYYEAYSTNPHNVDFSLGWKCEEYVQDTRKLVANFINGLPSEIIFIPSTTFGLNQLAFGLQNLINVKDEIVLTKAEHNANFLPWQRLATQKQAVIKYIPLDNLTITVDNILSVLTPQTKIVTFANVTNVLGQLNDTKAICETIKRYNPNIIVIVDAAQSINYIATDVKNWGIDFLVFSAHKMLGPTGIGVLWAKESKLKLLEPLLLGGGSSRGTLKGQLNLKFEAGTPNIAGIFGLNKAIEYLQKIGMNKIYETIVALKKYAVQRIRAEQLAVTIYNETTNSGILVFNVNNVNAHDVSANLANKYDICLRSGTHCSPLTKEIFLVPATVRASFYIYNTKDDVDKLISALKKGGNFLDDIL